jgi:hypothetical protein
VPNGLETPDPLTGDQNLGPVGGQARGYMMLSLMEPKARATSEKQVEILIRSNVHEVYLGVLTDGTFSFDAAYLEDVLTRLATAGRTITLALYLTNGSTMRDWKTTQITAAFDQYDPVAFRELIRFHAPTQKIFRDLTARVKPIFLKNKALGSSNTNLVSVMLEDNLDRDSYITMRDQARSVLGDVAKFIRNPCVNCGVDGTDPDTVGDPLEVHSPDLMSTLQNGDGLTLDGTGYSFPGETGSTQPKIGSFAEVADEALSKKLGYFGLWRAERQGLGAGSNKNVLPENRNYEVPTEDQARQEIEILRQGLTATQ